MAMRHEFYVIGATHPIGPFRSRKVAERELCKAQAEMRANDPDPDWGDDDFGMYVQHRQF